MGISCYDGRVRRALETKGEVLWMGIGRTTAWTEESNPPDESPDTSAIEEGIVYVLPAEQSLAAVVTSGEDFEINGTKYALVADVDAYTEAARFLYLRVVFDPDIGQPYNTFRQHGVTSGLVPVGGHESDQWLAPANISDPGILEYYENHTPRSLGPGDSRQIELVIEFR